MASSRSVEDSAELGISMSVLIVVPGFSRNPTRRPVSSLIPTTLDSDTQRRGTSTGSKLSGDSGVYASITCLAR